MTRSSAELWHQAPCAIRSTFSIIFKAYHTEPNGIQQGGGMNQCSGDELSDVQRPARDSYFMSVARCVSQRSNCRKRQIGAILSQRVEHHQHCI